MTMVDPFPSFAAEHISEPNLICMTPHHERIEEIYRMRERYALVKGWEKAEDPDYYDAMDTVTFAVATESGKFRASLRLTRLDNDTRSIHERCLSLQMLGEDTSLRRNAEAGLANSDVIRSDDTIYDMTRFVIDTDGYTGSLRDKHRVIKEDFLMMIGGAVAATEQGAFANNTAVWLFTAGPEMRHLLERHHITPVVLADAQNDEGVRLQFCAIRPGKSFGEVQAGDSIEAHRAARAIALGRQAVSV